MRQTPSLTHQQFFQNTRCPVVVHREPRQKKIGQHRHEFFEIVWILSGSAHHVTGTFRHQVSAGDVLVIDPHRAHGYEEPRELNLVNILIRADHIPALRSEFGDLPGYHALFTLAADHWEHAAYSNRLQLPQADTPRMTDWVDRMDAESAHGSFGGHAIAVAYLTLLVGHLSRLHGTNTRKTLKTKPRDGLSRLLSWIEIHLAEELPVPQLAQEAGLTERTFRRRFVELTGTSPTEYLLRRRLERAKILLKVRPRLPVADVAARCGFDDPNYFSRRMRERLGASPRAWALKHSTSAS
jgi:AraC family L-rhamnose operon transcriptional activator RhaR